MPHVLVSAGSELALDYEETYLRKLTLQDLLRVLKLDVGKRTKLGLDLLRLSQMSEKVRNCFFGFISLTLSIYLNVLWLKL